MKIYTRRGDGGETDLLGGVRVAKSDARVAAYGEIDELNAHLGAAGAASGHQDIQAFVEHIQRTLFQVGAALAAPDAKRREKSGVETIGEAEVEALEQRIDALDEELEPLRSFVLPGGTRAAAAFHVARGVCRRAERRVAELERGDSAVAAALGYLNRLSDLLFTLARVENRRAGVADVQWQGRRR